MARIKPEFDRRNVKIIGLSVDPVDNHARWADDIRETQGHAPNYPMIGDTDLSISKAWGMLPASASGDASKRTPADNETVTSAQATRGTVLDLSCEVARRAVDYGYRRTCFLPPGKKPRASELGT
jgi:alkyl hydroperoxide reductase subunit AhpC